MNLAILSLNIDIIKLNYLNYQLFIDFTDKELSIRSLKYSHRYFESGTYFLQNGNYLTVFDYSDITCSSWKKIFFSENIKKM